MDGGGVADVAREVLPIKLGAGEPLRGQGFLLPLKVLHVGRLVLLKAEKDLRERLDG